jgi:uncharacterized cofD-like protein
MMDRARVVTIGGGHGQSAVLEALRALDCDITALVSVADDGGCSGRLRREFGMPPPGDVRRCLIALARDRDLAARFALRNGDKDSGERSAGNLVLLEAYARTASLQGAVDWASALLSCDGQVIPVAEEPGTLTIYDRHVGELSGETLIERRGHAPLVVAVHGLERANPRAIEALRRADVVILTPGSFITSTLAALTTPGIAEALSSARAERIVMHNLRPEPGLAEGLTLVDRLRLLRDHVVIGGGEADMSLVVLCHAPWAHGSDGASDEGAYAHGSLADGTPLWKAPLATHDDDGHTPPLVAGALGHFLRLPWRRRASAPPRSEALAAFEDHLTCARLRLYPSPQDVPA